MKAVRIRRGAERLNGGLDTKPSESFCRISEAAEAIGALATATMDICAASSFRDFKVKLDWSRTTG